MAANPLVKKIVALLSSEAHERQIAAAIVLGELGQRDPVVVEGLCAAARAGLPPVQRHALDALGRLAAAGAVRGTAGKVLPVALPLLAARDEAVRAAAVSAVVAFGDAVVGQVRQRLAAATDPAERRALEEILGRVGGRDAFGALLEGLDAEDVEVAKAAALAARRRIKEAGPREKAGYFTQVGKLLANKKETARSPALTAAALKILGYLEDARATPTLLAFARNARAPEPVRQEAVIALRFTAASAGAATTRAVEALVALAETSPAPLARTALYTLASVPIPARLAGRLGKLALAAEPERGQLAIERLGQIPGPQAGKVLADLLGKAPDRGRAEAAANALGARPEAARALAEATLALAASKPDRDRLVLLARLLRPRAQALAAGKAAAEKKLARSLIDAAVAAAGTSGAGAEALLMVAREIDGAATAAGLRGLAARLGKAKKTDERLAVLRLVGASADATPDDGYALAAAELTGGRRDEALTVAIQLLGRGFDLAAAVRADRTLDAADSYQLGFALLERRHPAGEEILGDLARSGRSKVAGMAKAKLRSAGYE
jgi:hypothetical protein